MEQPATYDQFAVLVVVRIRSTVLTQPGTPVSFQGMFIYLLFDFRKTSGFDGFTLAKGLIRGLNRYPNRP